MLFSARLSARLTKSPGPFIDTCSSLTSPKSRLRPRPALMAAPVITVIKADRIMEVFQRRRETEAGLGKAPRRGKCAPARATLAHSIDVRNETPGTRPIGVVFGAEGFAEQSLLSSNARQQDTERQNGNDDAHPRAERQAPTKHEDEETEITRVANDPVEPTGDQPMFGLDRNQAAEATSKHEDRREAKNAAGRIKENTEPAHAFAAEGEEIDPICIGREIGVEDTEHAERGEHPTIGTIFPDAGADMALAEQSCDPERDRDSADRNQRRIGKETTCPACADNCQPQKGDDAPHRGGGKPRLDHGPRSSRLAWLQRLAAKMTRPACTHAPRSSSRFALAKTDAPDDSLPNVCGAQTAGRGEGIVHGVRYPNRARRAPEADRGDRREDRRSRIRLASVWPLHCQARV